MLEEENGLENQHQDNEEHKNEEGEGEEEEKEEEEPKPINPYSYIPVMEKITSILGEKFVDNKNELVKDIQDEVFSCTLLGIFFTAGWASPCKIFEKNLIDIYNEVNEGEKIFEIIQIPFDKTEEDFKKSIVGKPWKSIPWNDPIINKLKEAYKVLTIPQFFPIDKEGRVMSYNAREELTDRGCDVCEDWVEYLNGEVDKNRPPEEEQEHKEEENKDQHEEQNLQENKHEQPQHDNPDHKQEENKEEEKKHEEVKNAEPEPEPEPKQESKEEPKEESPKKEEKEEKEEENKEVEEADEREGENKEEETPQESAAVATESKVADSEEVAVPSIPDQPTEQNPENVSEEVRQ